MPVSSLFQLIGILNIAALLFVTNNGSQNCATPFISNVVCIVSHLIQ